MKNLSLTRIFSLFSLVLLIASCSKETVNSAGRDVAQNIIRTDKWRQQTKIVSGNADASLNVTIEMLDEGDYLEFKKDNRAWTYRKADGSASSVEYSMPTNRKMIFDGVEYDIKENIVQSITTLTLERIDGPMKTQIIFKRKRTE